MVQKGVNLKYLFCRINHIKFFKHFENKYRKMILVYKFLIKIVQKTTKNGCKVGGWRLHQNCQSVSIKLDCN